MMRPTVGVIGAGRVGAVLASRLRTAGYPIAAVSGRTPATQARIDAMLPGTRVAAPDAVAASCELLILAVPDDELISLTEQLSAAGAISDGQFVIHTSGRHGLNALEAATRVGARAIAFHPAMTFSGTAADLGRTCVFGLTAQPAEHALAEQLVADLGGTSVWVAEADRALYHSALVHGANHLSTLVAQAMDILRQAGATDPAAVLRPLLEASLDNSLTLGDAALTGPVVRGDVTTIRAHVDSFDAVGTDSATVDTYLELARATAGRAERAGRLAPSGATAIRQVLDEADWDTMAEIAAGLT